MRYTKLVWYFSQRDLQQKMIVFKNLGFSNIPSVWVVTDSFLLTGSQEHLNLHSLQNLPSIYSLAKAFIAQDLNNVVYQSSIQTAPLFTHIFVPQYEQPS